MSIEAIVTISYFIGVAVAVGVMLTVLFIKTDRR
jgi:hypothetical protein